MDLDTQFLDRTLTLPSTYVKSLMLQNLCIAVGYTIKVNLLVCLHACQDLMLLAFIYYCACVLPRCWVMPMEMQSI